MEIQNACHKLKLSTVYFDAVASGLKTFELRINDRNFQEGDFLQLYEYDTEKEIYTGNYVIVRVIYIFNDIKNIYLQKKYVAMSIDVLETHCINK